MKKIKKRGGGSEPVNITDHATTIDSQQSTLPLPTQELDKEHKDGRAQRSKAKVLWTDIEGRGTIRETRDNIYYYYYDPSQSKTPLIVKGDNVKLIKFAEYFRQTNYNFKQKNQCKEKAGLPRIQKHNHNMGKYISYNHGGGLRITRRINHKNYGWGTWHDEKEAVTVKNWLEEHDWPVEVSTNETRLKGEEYCEWLREEIKEWA